MRTYAFVTYLIQNDSYVPGALVLAHALREQETRADLVCLVAPQISDRGRRELESQFDRVIRVDVVSCGEKGDQRRQHVKHVLTRVNALRLGADGDLGCAYEKIVLLDADVLPIRCYDHLFLVDAPAGIVNERADSLKRTGSDRRYVVDGSLSHGRWQWHHRYRELPHGSRIPRRITDRVVVDSSNYGVNTAVLVLRPNMADYRAIRAQLQTRTGAAARLETFRWPDMQFLTAYWSGSWHNVDVCFAGLSGYPELSVLFGTHFAGPKPWDMRNRTVARRFSRFPDFQRWYVEYLELLSDRPGLVSGRRYADLAVFARSRCGGAVCPVRTAGAARAHPSV